MIWSAPACINRFLRAFVLWQEFPMHKIFPALLFSAMLFATLFAPVSAAQSFGGSPPWGTEKPVHIKGEVQKGNSFEHPIGRDLSLYVLSLNDAFKIAVWRTAAGEADDFTRCATGPFHGPNPTEIMAWHFAKDKPFPGRVGEKRWFDFALSPEDHEEQCRYLDCLLYPSNQDPACRQPTRGIGAGISGRGWLQITGIKLGDAQPGKEAVLLSMTFEAECSLFGALQLWILPATYIIPDDFAGWITVYHSERDAPKLPLAGNRYTLKVNKSGIVHTSSNLRSDLRGARFLSSGRKVLPMGASGRGMRCYGNWSIGDSAGNHSVQSFFVGTEDELRRNPVNRLLPPGENCPN
jgi:hypothetical protein